MRMSRDARVGHDLAHLSFKYGVTLTEFRGPSARLPERALSPEERQGVMEANIAEFGNSSHQSGQAVEVLRRANRDYESREALLTVMRSDALEVERSAALVALLRRGLDAHPLFTRIAGAEDVAEIRGALAEIDRPAGVRRPIGKIQSGARRAVKNFSEWAWAVVGGYA